MSAMRSSARRFLSADLERGPLAVHIDPGLVQARAFLLVHGIALRQIPGLVGIRVVFRVGLRHGERAPVSGIARFERRGGLQLA